tara:strand:+ start:715 stop:1377 length:663 start_codon:yes stop_codon:yes gene_type:complete
VIHRIVEALEETQQRKVLLTLTSVGWQDWPGIMSAWAAMWKRLKRRMPWARYAAVKEVGAETGMKHLHVVIIGWKWVAWRDLCAWWEELSGAWNTDVRQMDGASTVAHYVAKYVSKALGRLRAKVVTYSRGFGRPHRARLSLGRIELLDWDRKPEHVSLLTALGALVSPLKEWGSCSCFLDCVVPGFPRVHVWLASRDNNYSERGLWWALREPDACMMRL